MFYTDRANSMAGAGNASVGVAGGARTEFDSDPAPYLRGVRVPLPSTQRSMVTEVAQ